MCPPSPTTKEGARGSTPPTGRQHCQPQQPQAPICAGEAGAGGSGSAEKKSFEPYHAKSVPKPENLGASARQGHVSKGPITTMMLRNIPNKYAQSTLMEEIDEMGFGGTYDFFYLPMDVHNRSNVGYAFINFTTPDDAHHFHCLFKEHRFRTHQSRKISSVSAAHVQGLDANLRHFENRAVTHARNDQYRPVVLQGNKRIDFDEAVAGAAARGAAAKGGSDRSAKDGGGFGGARGARAAASPESPGAGRGPRAAKVPTPKKAPPQVAAAFPAHVDFVDALCGYLLSRQTSTESTADGGSVAPPPGLEADSARGARTAQSPLAEQQANWARQTSAPPNFRYGAPEEDGVATPLVPFDVATITSATAGVVAALAGARYRAHSAGGSACGGPALPSADLPAYVPLPSIPSISKLFVGCGLDDDDHGDALDTDARAPAAGGGAGVGPEC